MWKTVVQIMTNLKGDFLPMIAALIICIFIESFQISCLSIQRMSLSRSKESEFLKNDQYKYVIGVDEAGRGPLAGPVVAAACLIPQHCPQIDGIIDSKITTVTQREITYESLTSTPGIVWGVGIIEPKEIDEINILQASLKAMKTATDQLLSKLDENIVYDEYVALVDGNFVPKDMKVSAEAVIKGDSIIFSIAAASIIAKVTRDRIMIELDLEYPQYNFKQHKGYPTAAHRQVLHELGPSPAHRFSFGPVKIAQENLCNMLQRTSEKSNRVKRQHEIVISGEVIQKKARGTNEKTSDKASKKSEDECLIGLRRSSRLRGSQ